MTTTTDAGASPRTIPPIAYTWEQASQCANVPMGQLRQAARDGSLKVHRIGKHVRISEWALRAFIEGKEEVAAEVGYKNLVDDYSKRFRSQGCADSKEGAET